MTATEPLTPLGPLLRERIAIDAAGLGNMWPVFYDSALFARVIDEMAAPFEGAVDKIVGIESRGFVLGAAVASRLRVGFVAIRKADGLYPGEIFTAFTASDYRGRQHTFRLQRAAIGAGERIGLVDDWFETGSQGMIARQLVEQAGARYVGASIIVNQLAAEMRDALGPCHALVEASELNFP
ncbi:MAG TPA: phosphoribosyltransferase family protein [Solirubrobacteraceae bacterium]